MGMIRLAPLDCIYIYICIYVSCVSVTRRLNTMRHMNATRVRFFVYCA